MGTPVVSGAVIRCAMGLGAGQLSVTSQSKVLFGGAPAATIQDSAPMVNVGTCGMCTSMANPAVASATAAALGVLTPMPCIPAPAGIWISPGTPMISGIPGLSGDGTLICAYGGAITVIFAGQTTVKY